MATTSVKMMSWISMGKARRLMCCDIFVAKKYVA
jgi:hypothetical protein